MANTIHLYDKIEKKIYDEVKTGFTDTTKKAISDSIEELAMDKIKLEGIQIDASDLKKEIKNAIEDEFKGGYKLKIGSIDITESINMNPNDIVKQVLESYEKIEDGIETATSEEKKKLAALLSLADIKMSKDNPLKKDMEMYLEDISEFAKLTEDEFKDLYSTIKNNLPDYGEMISNIMTKVLESIYSNMDGFMDKFKIEKKKLNELLGGLDEITIGKIKQDKSFEKMLKRVEVGLVSADDAFGILMDNIKDLESIENSVSKTTKTMSDTMQSRLSKSMIAFYKSVKNSNAYLYEQNKLLTERAALMSNGDIVKEFENEAKGGKVIIPTNLRADTIMHSHAYDPNRKNLRFSDADIVEVVDGTFKKAILQCGEDFLTLDMTNVSDFKALQRDMLDVYNAVMLANGAKIFKDAKGKNKISGLDDFSNVKNNRAVDELNRLLYSVAQQHGAELYSEKITDNDKLVSNITEIFQKITDQRVATISEFLTASISSNPIKEVEALRDELEKSRPYKKISKGNLHIKNAILNKNGTIGGNGSLDSKSVDDILDAQDANDENIQKQKKQAEERSKTADKNREIAEKNRESEKIEKETRERYNQNQNKNPEYDYNNEEYLKQKEEYEKAKQKYTQEYMDYEKDPMVIRYNRLKNIIEMASNILPEDLISEIDASVFDELEDTLFSLTKEDLLDLGFDEKKVDGIIGKLSEFRTILHDIKSDYSFFENQYGDEATPYKVTKKDLSFENDDVSEAVSKKQISNKLIIFLNTFLENLSAASVDAIKPTKKAPVFNMKEPMPPKKEADKTHNTFISGNAEHFVSTLQDSINGLPIEKGSVTIIAKPDGSNFIPELQQQIDNTSVSVKVNGVDVVKTSSSNDDNSVKESPVKQEPIKKTEPKEEKKEKDPNVRDIIKIWKDLLNARKEQAKFKDQDDTRFPKYMTDAYAKKVGEYSELGISELIERFFSKVDDKTRYFTDNGNIAKGMEHNLNLKWAGIYALIDTLNKKGLTSQTGDKLTLNKSVIDNLDLEIDKLRNEINSLGDVVDEEKNTKLDSLLSLKQRLGDGNTLDLKNLGLNSEVEKYLSQAKLINMTEEMMTENLKNLQQASQNVQNFGKELSDYRLSSNYTKEEKYIDNLLKLINDYEDPLVSNNSGSLKKIGESFLLLKSENPLFDVNTLTTNEKIINACADAVRKEAEEEERAAAAAKEHAQHSSAIAESSSATTSTTKPTKRLRSELIAERETAFKNAISAFNKDDAASVERVGKAFVSLSKIKSSVIPQDFTDVPEIILACKKAYDEFKSSIDSSSEYDFSDELGGLDAINNKIKDEIIKSIEEKNRKFNEENQIVKNVASKEQENLEGVSKSVEQISESLVDASKANDILIDSMDGYEATSDDLKNVHDTLLMNHINDKPEYMQSFIDGMTSVVPELRKAVAGVMQSGLESAAIAQGSEEVLSAEERIQEAKEETQEASEGTQESEIKEGEIATATANVFEKAERKKQDSIKKTSQYTQEQLDYARELGMLNSSGADIDGRKRKSFEKAWNDKNSVLSDKLKSFGINVSDSVEVQKDQIEIAIDKYRSEYVRKTSKAYSEVPDGSPLAKEACDIIIQYASKFGKEFQQYIKSYFDEAQKNIEKAENNPKWAFEQRLLNKIPSKSELKTRLSNLISGANGLDSFGEKWVHLLRNPNDINSIMENGLNMRQGNPSHMFIPLENYSKLLDEFEKWINEYNKIIPVQSKINELFLDLENAEKEYNNNPNEISKKKLISIQETVSMIQTIGVLARWGNSEIALIGDFSEEILKDISEVREVKSINSSPKGDNLKVLDKSNLAGYINLKNGNVQPNKNGFSSDKSDILTESGTNLVRSIAEGVTEGQSEINDALENVSKNAKEHFEDINGIHSPADEWIPDGEYISKGIAEGVKNGEIFVNSALTNLYDSIRHNRNNPNDNTEKHFAVSRRTGASNSGYSSSNDVDEGTSIETIKNDIKNLENMGEVVTDYFHTHSQNKYAAFSFDDFIQAAKLIDETPTLTNQHAVSLNDIVSIDLSGLLSDEIKEIGELLRQATSSYIKVEDNKISVLNDEKAVGSLLKKNFEKSIEYISNNFVDSLVKSGIDKGLAEQQVSSLKRKLGFIGNPNEYTDVDLYSKAKGAYITSANATGFNKSKDLFDDLMGDIFEQFQENELIKILETKGLSNRYSHSSIVDFSKDFSQGVESYKKQGNNAGEGYKEGISETKDDIKNEVKDVVESGIQSAQEAQDSHSPSIEYYNLGVDAMQGYINGVKSMSQQVKDAVHNVIYDAIPNETPPIKPNSNNGKKKPDKSNTSDNDVFNQANDQNKSVKSYYDNLTKKAEKYVEIKLKGINANDEDLETLKEIEDEYDAINNKTSIHAINMDGNNNSIESAQKARQNFVDSIRNSTQNYKDTNIEYFTNQSKKLEDIVNNGKWTKEFQDKAQELIDKYQLIVSEIQEDEIGKELQDKIDTLKKRIDSILSDSKNPSNLSGNETKLLKLRSDLGALLQNTKMDPSTTRDVQDLLNKVKELLESGKYSKEIVEEVNKSFLNLKGTILTTGQAGKSMFTKIGEQISHLNAQYIARFLSFNDLINYGRRAFEAVRQIDTALVDLRKTTSMTSKELDEFYFESNNIAKQLGVTTAEIVNQASAFSRLGYSSKEAAITMSELSSQFASISPDMDVSTATDGLISVMKAFDVEVEDVERKILDNINIIGNTAATSNGEIVDMLMRSSAAMKEANNTLEETIALETAAVEITRNAESTGTAFKTVAMRIRGYDEETEELSADLENIAGDIANLTKTAKTPGGISLFTDANKTEYKSTYQLLKEISEIYDDLTDKEQAQLLEKLAG